ncbi:helix-turn-helix domain-containing protein [Yinghuangia seranimata]|uniref:helix-turn-helix domain-containing protein n=1 Tax=Yinghuangia seranimata TaxID=408067 RepID=UPI00248C8C75|nr:helix-turn-helix transcriptional regulator [Yinghuangia seranimata]MDI2128211.1 helix-turn-helix transcriptional regulator [Yinghuangia seranimata]
MTDQDESAEFLKGFGRQIRILRERAGFTRAQLGVRVGYSEDQITSVELGRRILKPEMLPKFDEALGAEDMLNVMRLQLEKARYPAFFRDAAKLEASAVDLRFYDTHVVNGLLQTEEYARAVFGTMRPPMDEAKLEERVASRLARQAVFARRPEPMMTFVMDESVLRRPIGGRQVLRGQLEQVLLVAQKATVEVQVLPLASEDNAGLAGPFTLTENTAGRRIGYVEVQTTSRVYTERAAVRALETKYGILRAQALTPRESQAFITGLMEGL